MYDENSKIVTGEVLRQEKRSSGDAEFRPHVGSVPAFTQKFLFDR